MQKNKTKKSPSPFLQTMGAPPLHTMSANGERIHHRDLIKLSLLPRPCEGYASRLPRTPRGYWLTVEIENGVIKINGIRFLFFFFFFTFRRSGLQRPQGRGRPGVLPDATQLPRGTSGGGGAESLAGLKTCQDGGTRGSPAAPSAAGNHSSLCEALVYWVTSIRVAQLLDRVCGRF